MKVHLLSYPQFGKLQVIIFLFLTLLPAHHSVEAQSLSVAEQSITKEKILSLYIGVSAPLDSVWERWSTEKGIRKFFAPACRFEPSVLSLFEIHFAPDAPEGQRGAENNRILSIHNKQMISFTWDAPPQWPAIRKHRTVVRNF